MEASSYERGAGGKFRKQPGRKPSTPYDRPPMETKSTGSLAHSQEKRNGWLSRIIDPASRIITSSATRFFASMFQKRLTAPAHHNPPDVKLEAVHNGHEQEFENPSGCTNKKFDGQEESARENSLCSRLHELEQMLKDKTLSRDDFNHLTEILQTRIVDSRSNGESEKVQFNTSKTAVACVAADDKNMHGYVKSLVVDTEAASPAEVAKAFMGSRVARISPGNSALCGHTFTNLASSTPQAQSLSVLNQINKTCGVSGAKVDGIFTLQSQGRYAPYSPAAPASAYLRFASDADCEAKNDEYVRISESQWAHDAPSSSRQALKRRSSVLDNDIGSISSIRRIRQKSNLLPAFKGFALPAGPSLSSSSSDAVQSSLPSSQKSVQFSLPKYKFPENRLVANGVNQTMPANVASVPRQSSERARKILEELDKIIPLPKEKSPELKLAIVRENSLAKLTCNMLGGKALRTMEDVDITKSSNRHGITLDCSSTARKWNHIEREDKVEENEPPENSANAITESKVGGLTKESSILPGALPGLKNRDSDSVRHPREARPFQMIAPEMDEDSYSDEEISAASLAQKEKEEPATETASLQKSLMHPPGGKPARPPSLITATSVDNSSDFNFTPPSNSISESLSVLARPSPVYGNTVETKGHAGEKGSLVPLSTADSPVVDSSSKSASDGTETEYSDTAVLKMTTLIQQRNSEPDKEVKPWKVEGTAMSSAFATTSSPSGNSGFGTSSPPSSSNGLANQSSASRAFFSSVVSVPPSAPQTTFSTHPTAISGSLGFQFGGGNSSPLAANLVPSSSKPLVTPIVSEKPLPVDSIGSSSVTIPAPSAPVSGTSFTATAASTQVDSSSLAASSSLGNQLTEAGAGSAPLTGNPPSHLSSSTPSSTSGLPVASTFGAVSSPFGSSVFAAPVIGSSSSVTTIVSFDADIQKTSAPSSVLVKPHGTECSSLFNSGFTSSFSGMGGLSFGASSSGATAATSTFSFGDSAAGAASTTVGFSFGGSSTNLTASSASTGFSFTGLSSSSASSSPSTTGIFPCATASSTASSPTGFSFGGSSVGASASSSSSIVFAFGGSSVGGTASSSTAGFSFGVSSVGANASSSSTTGFSFGLSAVGASGSSSNAGFSFGGSTAGASTLSSVTGFPFGGSSGSSTNSSAITSFSTGPSLAAVSSAATGFSFGLSSSASLPATIGFSFGAGTSSSATTAAFSFGTSSSLNNSPFLFGSSAGTSASTGSLFSFTPTSSTTGFTSKTGSTFPPQSMVMFGSASPTNDQMNFEDSMADDVFHASAPVTPAFAMSSTPSSNFKFGFPNVPTVGQPFFSFGAPQGLPSSQAPSPFAAGGSLEFAGGSFSLGTNGGDKSGRKIVRVKRDKVRKK